MLPAEMTSTAATPRMILARNRRVGNKLRLDGDAVRPDIPNPHSVFSRDPEAPRPQTWMRKTKAESIKGGKFVRSVFGSGESQLREGGPERARVLRPTGKRLILTVLVRQ